jgi:DNA-binding NarL/FixJ family response regulator
MWTPIRVVLVDDVAEFRSLLRHRLGAHEGIVVVGEAGDGYAAIRVAVRTKPDVIVLDLEMPNCDGMTAIPLLRKAAPDARLIVLSAFPEPYTLGDLLQQGVDGYLDKLSSWSELGPALVALCAPPSCVDA